MCITNFVIGNVINSGSYGTVRKAVDIRTNEIVAMTPIHTLTQTSQGK